MSKTLQLMKKSMHVLQMADGQYANSAWFVVSFFNAHPTAPKVDISEPFKGVQALNIGTGKFYPVGFYKEYERIMLQKLAERRTPKPKAPSKVEILEKRVSDLEAKFATLKTEADTPQSFFASIKR